MYKYRLYPNKATDEKLRWVIDCCRELYNAALAERKEAYRMAGKFIGYYEQDHSLVEIKRDIRPEYREITSHVLRNVLKRVDLAFQSFFRRVKRGTVPGFPRFKGKNWYDSFTYPDSAGWKLFPAERVLIDKGARNVKLHLTNIGSIRLRLHRSLGGDVKSVTIKREGEQWYAVFSCEITDTEPLLVSHEDVGIDLGITHFAALSNGEFIENPRLYRKTEKKLAKLHQSLSRKKRGSHRRKKAVQAVSRAYRKVRNQRLDFSHKASLKLVSRYQIIVLENLRPSNLIRRPKPIKDEATGEYLPNGAASKSGLNKSMSDASWGMFTRLLSVKAVSAGRLVAFVSPQYTSQTCSQCGAVRKKTLEERWHSCECGCELDRDTNAAINILKKYQVRTGPTQATA